MILRKDIALLLSFSLMFFIVLGAVSASDDGGFSFENNLSLGNENGAVIDDSSSIEEIDESNRTASFKCDDSNVVSGQNFSVKLLDGNGTGIANKSVYFTFNNVKSNITTDCDGVAKLIIKAKPGNYNIKYSFNESGYVPVNGQTKIFVFSTSTSNFVASDYDAYVGFKNTFKVVLKVGNTLLSNRIVTFTIKGSNYNVKTNSKGEARLDINLKAGTYSIRYSYLGEKNIKGGSGTSKIKVKSKMPTKIIKYNSVIYRHKTKAPFKVKLINDRGYSLSGKKVVFKVNNKKYTKKTNSKGIASINIKLKADIYKLKVTFSKDSKYKKTSKTFNVKVKTKKARNNGMWLLSTDMEKVNFNLLKSYGTKHIFLNAKSLERFGQDYVEKFIKNAKAHGIKVHIWMQVFYNGGKWISPVKNGTFKYDLINSKVKLAKSYAKIKNVAGVHFDYLRFPHSASTHKNGVKAINYFTKKATSAVHAVNPKLIVSAAVMPELSSMKKAYGQDIGTLSKYLDVIIPMVYKGNYHASNAWIKKTTQTFVKESKKAKIWTGIQTYKSDSNLNYLSTNELMNDADAAAYGGAYGVILFRYGLINYINFNDV